MSNKAKSRQREAGRGSGSSLLTVCLTVVLFPLAITGSSVALPAINGEFHNSLAAGQWVVNGYNLTYAAFMPATGSLADLLGRRRVFRVGVSLFVLGSLVSTMRRHRTGANTPGRATARKRSARGSSDGG